MAEATRWQKHLMLVRMSGRIPAWWTLKEMRRWRPDWRAVLKEEHRLEMLRWMRRQTWGDRTPAEMQLVMRVTMGRRLLMLPSTPAAGRTPR